MGVRKKMPEVAARGDLEGTVKRGIQSYRYKESYDMSDPLKAPFPYAGGKSTAAAAVWARLGDTPNAVETHCGSSAWTLARPHDLTGKTETINDADGLLVNSLRAIAYDPDQTAYWCDWPVSEVDLTARHLWLKAQREELTQRLFADPDYCDPKAAGWWLWGAASWIGDGWCVADGPWINQDGRLVDRRAIGRDAGGVWKAAPVVGAPGQGVPKGMPDVGAMNGANQNRKTHENIRGIQRYRDAPGVRKKMPMVSAQPDGNGQQKRLGTQSYTAPAALFAYFERLATRLRRVRILCGDWRRVVKPSITTNHGMTALFMDPEYPADEHDMTYHQGEKQEGKPHIWYQVAQWAVENGDNPLLRIAVCGYHSDATDALFPLTWERYRWEARGGYSNQKADGRGRDNAKREIVWFSPHCLNPADEARAAFDRPIVARASDYTGTLFEEE